MYARNAVHGPNAPLSENNGLVILTGQRSEPSAGPHKHAIAMLPSTRHYATIGPRRQYPSIPAACVACRRKHLKCDGQRPCSRCRATTQHCVYVASRRGYNGRKSMAAQSIAHLEATENHGPVATRAATTIDSGPPLFASEYPSFFDPPEFSHVIPDHSGIGTPPIGMYSQTTASSSFPAYSFQSPFGGIGGEPHLGFDYEIPRALPQRDPYLESFYGNFYAAHPFILPKEPLIVLAQETPLEPLFAAMRWIGSLFIERNTSPSLFREAFRLIDGNTVKDGFLVQARLLLAIGLDGNHRLEKSRKLMAEARDMSIQIEMNSQAFAANNGRASPIIEESWRRTWWELYVVDALMSGVHQANIFTLYDVHSNVALPCEEHEYLTGEIPPLKQPNNLESIGLYDRGPFSSYTYRIQCACFLGIFQRTPTEIEHIDRLLANWMLRLPPSKYDAYAKGESDEMLFQAIMTWHAITILLHQPHSQLDPSPTYNIQACAPNTPALSKDAFNSHTKRTIRSATELSKLIMHRVPLLKHTHFFSYMVTLSSTIHLSRWSLTFVAPDDDELRQSMRQNIGALIKYSAMWPMAQYMGCQVKQIAKEIYTMKKRERQRAHG
ncbi:uncharacterized protein B0J16DRAFT_349310 [Fusarium flagelliforme]|uniref:uncharacterized protein n=1 Tax=Fusarium flagelliforme TaxID=2675880 RepID=UPI001E8DAF4C|nr:uncharacterized protein B0J16DRAFT_349310 [Fusarium flagelliforme]KAH7174883.1 hypothetical protein B0J16DRAFT_349310 [Fusarium flagelliforme]